MSKRSLHPGIMLALAVLLAATLAGLLAGQTVRVGNADLGGVVSSRNGPEAGVWVIAETTDLPIHSPWLLTFEAIPFPAGPVPGKSLLDGTCSKENLVWL